MARWRSKQAKGRSKVGLGFLADRAERREFWARLRAAERFLKAEEPLPPARPLLEPGDAEE